MMKVLVCPDSFKGSLSAAQASRAIAEGFSKVFPLANIVQLPLADGGEGTVEALVTATGGEILRETVQGPLGDPVEACFGILGDKMTAVVEMASASGLPLIPENKRNPSITSTYGTGELIRKALDYGCRQIIIGIGGSATNDGGSGAMSALGVKFKDKDGKILPPGGLALKDLASIDLSELDPRIQTTHIDVACDVTNPLCGSEGASAMFGPQKGASPEMVAKLDASLLHYGTLLEKVLNLEILNVPGAGAAGGLGAALLGFLNARLRSGIEIVLEAIGFEEQLHGADLVITGEGKLDAQTAHGKAIDGVATAAHRVGVPVLALAGCVMDGAEELVDAAAATVPGPMSLDDAMHSAEKLLCLASERVARALALGIRLVK